VANAHDAKKRFERTVTGKPIASLPLAKVRARHLKEWFDGLGTDGLSKPSANRTLAPLKAKERMRRITCERVNLQSRCVPGDLESGERLRSRRLGNLTGAGRGDSQQPAFDSISGNHLLPCVGSGAGAIA